ncbi:hypothetical protein [Kitasatospora purpeofusca]|uniref:hypothetical protein n=1 Tax=Kitasatospora purpeofusca TaxID=67352 RepID=UPI0036A41A40
MNPHDPCMKPGAHLVHERLGVDNPRDLHHRHPDDRALARLGHTVATATRDVDALHQELVATAQQVIERLEPIARGDHASMLGVNGIMQSVGLQVELLTARRGAAYQQLSGALTAYVLSADDAGLPPAEPALTRDLRQEGPSVRASIVEELIAEGLAADDQRVLSARFRTAAPGTSPAVAPATGAPAAAAARRR